MFDLFSLRLRSAREADTPEMFDRFSLRLRSAREADTSTPDGPAELQDERPPDRPVEAAPLAPPPSAWQEHRRNAARIAELERELVAARTALAATADESVDGDDIDALVAKCVVARTETTRLEIHLDVLRRRQIRLGDELHALKVAARHTEQAKRQDGIAELTRDLASIEEEKRSHQEALEALDVRDDEARVRLQHLERQIGELAVVEKRHVASIDPATVSPDVPPPGALIRPSQWHAFITEVRARGISGSVWIHVDEHSGEIIHSSLQELS